MGNGRIGPIARLALRLPAHLYDWRAGWLLGQRFLRLTHLGRRTGRRYHAVLEVVSINEVRDEFVVMSGFGVSADWYRDLQALPAVEIAVGRRRFRPQHRLLDQPEASAILAAYEQRNWHIVPVVRRVLGRLAGWRYDGSDEARARLVQQLPMVAFRPLPVGGDSFAS